ncbi:MAG: NADH-quinone oxidoreductase subunit NuoE [candidate division KSB1 bacterium]|nr:NADH-quinone oxidoreductase subunit NuoE [candidate division KSB1 bacterium]
MAVSEDAIQGSGAEPRASLIELLKRMQETHGCLSQEVLTKVAAETGLPLSKIYGVATFYTLLTTRPKGRYRIFFCKNAPCHVRGARRVLEAIVEYLGVQPGETTPDGLFTLELTSCLGLCAVAPAMMVGDDVYGNLTPQKAMAILEDYRTRERNEHAWS